MEKAYVYPFHGSAAELARACADWLTPPLQHWSAGQARLELGQGLPAQWQEQGAVFSAGGEVRWWQQGEDYEAVLLSDAPLPGREPDAGWEAEDATLLLQDLSEARVTPQFDRYPTGRPTGRMRARVYRQAGATRLISLRELID